MSTESEQASWAFDGESAVVVHIDGVMFRLDRDPMPELDEKQQALALALVRVAGARLERQAYPLRSGEVAS